MNTLELQERAHGHCWPWAFAARSGGIGGTSGFSREDSVVLSSFWWHCKLFYCDFLARGSIPGGTFAMAYSFLRVQHFWQFEKFGAAKAFLLLPL